MQRANYIDCNVLPVKHLKNHEDSLTLVFTFHPALHVTFDVLKSAHGCIVKSPLLKSVLQKLARMIFCSTKSLRSKLIRSKLKLEDEKKQENFPRCRKICDRPNISNLCNDFRSTVTGEIHKMNFHFNCNSDCAVYLLVREKFVTSNIIDQLLPSLDPDLTYINQTLNFTVNKGYVFLRRN